jgi:hypothetical protein
MQPYYGGDNRDALVTMIATIVILVLTIELVNLNKVGVNQRNIQIGLNKERNELMKENNLTRRVS